MPEPLEIRPSSWRRLAIVLGIAGFTVAGVYLIAVGGVVEKLAGALAVLFFGVLGSWSLTKQWGRTVTLRLLPDRLEWVYPLGTASLPWVDIEAVGVTREARTSLVGLRLTSYDGYLASITPELREWLDRANRAGGLFGPAITAFGGSALGRAVSEVEDLRGAMALCRSRYGYDLTLGWHERDRSADELAALLERYRAAAGPS